MRGSRPLITALKIWLRQQRTRVSKKRETGKASSTASNAGLLWFAFVGNGRLSMSNNAGEREPRALRLAVVTGPSPSQTKVPTNRCHVIQIATAKLNSIDPQAWFTDMLAHLPDHPVKARKLLTPHAAFPKTICPWPSPISSRLSERRAISQRSNRKKSLVIHC